MIIITEINSLEYLSQKIISSLTLSGVELRQFQYWYSDIGDQDIQFGHWLI